MEHASQKDQKRKRKVYLALPLSTICGFEVMYLLFSNVGTPMESEWILNPIWFLRSKLFCNDQII